MKRKTLDQYPSKYQDMIVGALHPAKAPPKPIAHQSAWPALPDLFNPSCPCERCGDERARLHEKHIGAPLTPAKPPHSVFQAPEAAKIPSAYPFTLWLDYRVPSLNTITGQWGKVSANRDAAKALDAILPILGRYPRQPQGTRLLLIYTCYVCQLRDADNPTTKFLNDQFRRVGLLLNDDPACMALLVNPEVKVGKRCLEGTKVTFTEALP